MPEDFNDALDRAIELASDDATRDALTAIRDGQAGSTNDAGGPAGGGGHGDPDDPKVGDPVD